MSRRGPPSSGRTPRAPWLAVSVVCFGAFMGQLDASIVTITFPAMQRKFSAPSLVGGLVSMARGIGTTFGIALMALAWHLGSHSYQAGNPGYSGSEQARPAFAVLAVGAATAAAIALASLARARRSAERPREGSPSGADH